MALLHRQVRQLNVIHKRIISELKKKDPSIDELKFAFKLRNTHIKQMEAAVKATKKENLSDSEWRSLEKLFSESNSLSETIQNELKTMLDHQKEQLDDASGRRKAEDAYRMLK